MGALRRQTTVDDMVRALAVAHGADAGDIADDVWRTVAKLAELGLVAQAGPGTGEPPAH